MDLLRRLTLIQRSDSSMLAIGEEVKYRFVARSLFGWGPKGEPNASITAVSEVVDFSEAVEAGLAIGLVHVSYRDRGRV
jgi:hypothetical protein